MSNGGTDPAMEMMSERERIELAVVHELLERTQEMLGHPFFKLVRETNVKGAPGDLTFTTTWWVELPPMDAAQTRMVIESWLRGVVEPV